MWREISWKKLVRDDVYADKLVKKQPQLNERSTPGIVSYIIMEVKLDY